MADVDMNNFKGLLLGRRWQEATALIATNSSVAKEKNGAGLFPLHFACAYKATLEVIRALLNAYPEAAAKKAKNGWTPLHYLFLWIDIYGAPTVDVVEKVLEENPQAKFEKDRNNMTPIQIASQYGSGISENVFIELLSDDPEGVFTKNVWGKSAVDGALHNEGIKSQFFWSALRFEEVAGEIDNFLQRNDVNLLPPNPEQAETRSQAIERFVQNRYRSLAKVKRECDRLQRERDQLQRERDQLQRERDPQLQSERDHLQRERDQLQSERDQLQSERDQLTTSNEDLEAVNRNLNMDLDESEEIRKRDISDLTEDLDKANKKIRLLTDDLQLEAQRARRNEEDYSKSKLMVMNLERSEENLLERIRLMKGTEDNNTSLETNSVHVEL